MKVDISNQKLQQNNYPQRNSNNNNSNYAPAFKGGPLDGLINQALTTIETNPMVDAALVDVFAMVAPRTYVDTKDRNGYAGTETFIREAMGTFCVCLSSGIFAKGIARLYNNFVEPETKINPDIWATKDGLALLNHAWDKTENKATGEHSVEKYVSNVLTNITGKDGNNDVTWESGWNKETKWLDDPKWKNYSWKDAKFNGIQNTLINEKNIVKTLSDVIQDKNIDKKDAKQILNIISYKITNALGVGESIDVTLDDKKLGSSMSNLIRDTYDIGKGIFTNKSIDTKAALAKLTKMSKVKTLGALSVSSFLALITQYVNRQITKKRTGTDAFVGDVNYDKIKKEKIDNNNTDNADKASPEKKSNARLWGLKVLASVGMIGMSAKVMGIKSLKLADFTKKLEFTGAVTSGNAMKTIYAAQLVGRFLASSDENELRESSTRDYLGFLNWLVFGGFVSKGVAKLLDSKNEIFNGKSVKSHAEIASKGKEFAEKNIWKKNVAQASGLIYSTVALGILLPKLNIAITKYKQQQKQKEDAASLQIV